MFFRSTLALLTLALGAAAQSSSETSSAAAATPSINSCVLQCLQSSQSSSTCTLYTDLSCTCTNSGYQTAVATCIASACPDQLGAATELQATECPSSGSSSAGSSGTSTAPASGSSSTSTSAAGSSSSSSSSGSSSGAAANLNVNVGGFVGAAVVGVVGAVLGGVVAL